MWPLGGICCLVSFFSLSVIAAEEELILLTIKGDLIGPAESLGKESSSDLIVSTYYSLLSVDVQTKIESFRHQLYSLIPDYEVAFTATDSAELSEIIDEINVLWTAIEVIHAQHFTAEVVQTVNKTYADVFALVNN